MSDPETPLPPHLPPERPQFCGACGLALERADVPCPRCGAWPGTLPVAAAAPPPPAPGAGETNGMAVASLVLGIMWLYWIGSILAIIFGHIALAQIRRSEGSSLGRGMAIAGIVLGYVGVGVAILIVVLALSLHWFVPMHGRGVMV